MLLKYSYEFSHSIPIVHVGSKRIVVASSKLPLVKMACTKSFVEVSGNIFFNLSMPGSYGY
jgi:hypothetical protein